MDPVEIANAAAAWIALAISGWTAWSEVARRRREAKSRESERLALVAEAVGADSMHVDVHFRPPAKHTRYYVIVRAVRPANAVLSKPCLKPPPPGVISIGRPVWDPHASEWRQVTLSLRSLDRETLSADFIVRGLDAGRAVLHLAVFDHATEQALVEEQRAVAAWLGD